MGVVFAKPEANDSIIAVARHSERVLDEQDEKEEAVPEDEVADPADGVDTSADDGAVPADEATPSDVDE
jgi:DNA gyrase subunit A